jgi:hypothetical protein
MVSPIKQLFEWWLKRKHRGGFVEELQDERDYVLGGTIDDIKNWVLGKDYIPKNTETHNSGGLLEIKDQSGQNSCVVESGTAGKEVDEGMLLDIRWMCAYLRDKGQMNANGTSLSYYQNALKNVGIPKRFSDQNHLVSWNKFSERALLSCPNDANVHKIKSYFKTFDLNVILEQLDNGRMGHTGGSWYTGYNSSSLNDLGIVLPFNGYNVGGHATLIVDYDLNYYGTKVFKVLNSYGKQYGKGGFFYVKFEDIFKVFSAGVYFNSDLDKDAIGFCSAYQNRLVKEINGAKIYLISKDKKRHIPDEAFLWMLNKDWIEDGENILPLIPEGDDLTFEEIPEEDKKRIRELIRMSKDETFFKSRFEKYYPDLFTN